MRIILKVEEDFVKHEKHHGLSDDEMKEAWKLISPEKQPVNRGKVKDEKPSDN